MIFRIHFFEESKSFTNEPVHEHFQSSNDVKMIFIGTVGQNWLFTPHEIQEIHLLILTKRLHTT